MEPLHVSDEAGKKIGVLVLVSDYEKLLAELKATKKELSELKATLQQITPHQPSGPKTT